LRTIAEKLPENIGDASINPGEVSLTDDGGYIHSTSVDYPKGKKQAALEFANAGPCTMFLAEVTLTYHARRMHLLFNLNVGRGQPDQRLVIDSLRFQEGTFMLDMNNWISGGEKVVPATRWKKIEIGRALLDRKSG